MNHFTEMHQTKPVVAQLLKAQEVREKYGHVVDEGVFVLCTRDVPGITSAAVALPSGGIQLESYVAAHMLFADQSAALWCVFDTADMVSMEYLTYGLLGGFLVLFVTQDGGSRLISTEVAGGPTSRPAQDAADFWESELENPRDEEPSMFFRLCLLAASSQYEVAHALGLSIPPSAVQMRCVLSEAAAHA